MPYRRPSLSAEKGKELQMKSLGIILLYPLMTVDTETAKRSVSERFDGGKDLIMKGFHPHLMYFEDICRRKEIQLMI